MKHNDFNIWERAFIFPPPLNVTLKPFFSFFFFLHIWLTDRFRLRSHVNISDATWRHQPWNPNWRQIFSARSGFSNFCFPRHNGVFLLTDGRVDSFVNNRVKKNSLEGFELVKIFPQVGAMFVVCLRTSFWGRWTKYLESFVVSPLVVLHF